jgi:hypothetical protein
MICEFQMFVITLLKIVSVLRWGVGITILAAAWLLKEDEEGRITNWLEDKRKAVAKRHDQTLSKAAIYVQSLASVVTGLFTTVFGKRLLSIHAIFISLLLSLLTFVLPLAAAMIIKGPSPENGGMNGIYAASFMALILVTSTIVCIRYSSSKITKIIEGMLFTVAIASYVVGYVWLLSHVYHMDDVVTYSLIMVGAVLSISIDLLFIMVMRWSFQKIDSANSIRAIVLLLFVATLTSAIIIVGTASLFIYIRHTNLEMFAEYSYMPHRFGFRDVVLDLAETMAIVGLSCAFDTLLSCSILVICLGISFNTLAWAFVDRNIYSFNRHKVLMNKKLLWSAGIAICTEPHIWDLAVRAVRTGWF